jgi:hypothetical protein
MSRLTTYTEMNTVLHRRTGLPQFNFELDHDRAAMGYLLSRILELDRPTSGRMITALVNYLDQNDAGPGFYRIAQQYGLLRKNASERDKFEFWASEVTAVTSTTVGTIETRGVPRPGPHGSPVVRRNGRELRAGDSDLTWMRRPQSHMVEIGLSQIGETPQTAL